MNLYHGTGSKVALHVGICLAKRSDYAESYASRYQPDNRRIATVTINLDGLTVDEVDGYDRDSDEAPGDRDIASWAGPDVIIYDDEDVDGRAHVTYRLMTACAVAAARIVEIVDGEGYNENENGEPYLTA